MFPCSFKTGITTDRTTPDSPEPVIAFWPSESARILRSHPLASVDSKKLQRDFWKSLFGIHKDVGGGRSEVHLSRGIEPAWTLSEHLLAQHGQRPILVHDPQRGALPQKPTVNTRKDERCA